MIGIELMDNFNAPYYAQSVSEFWRRWHISLSTWFKDYVYIPIGGSRKGKIRNCINLMAVFLASGLWHGAAWTYVIWGGINGAFQVVSKLTTGMRNYGKEVFMVHEGCFSHRLLKTVMTFSLIDLAWFFSAYEGCGISFRYGKTSERDLTHGSCLMKACFNAGSTVKIFTCRSCLSVC